MNKTVKKIVVILIILILLPAAFLTINEFVSLNQNEKVIGRIYSNQLDAILYSVNQYSEDVVSSWASRVDLFLDEVGKLNVKNIPSAIDSFYDQFPSLTFIFVADSVNDSQIEIIRKNVKEKYPPIEEPDYNSSIKKLLSEKRSLLTRLIYI